MFARFGAGWAEILAFDVLDRLENVWRGWWAVVETMQ